MVLSATAVSVSTAEQDDNTTLGDKRSCEKTSPRSRKHVSEEVTLVIEYSGLVLGERS